MANVSATLREALRQLRADRDRLDEVLRRFDHTAKPTASCAKAQPIRKRRRMGAQDRKAVSQHGTASLTARLSSYASARLAGVPVDPAEEDESVRLPPQQAAPFLPQP